MFPAKHSFPLTPGIPLWKGPYPEREMSRSCGECTACCTVLRIEEVLNKPAYQTCHAVIPKGGCKVYKDRPPPCSAFRCYWLQDPGGYANVDTARHAKTPDGKKAIKTKMLRFTSADRPDRLGVMFSSQFLLRKEQRGRVIAAHELWPGASKKPRAATIIRSLSHYCVVFIHNSEGRLQMIGPDEEVKVARDIFQEANPRLSLGLQVHGDW